MENKINFEKDLNSQQYEVVTAGDGPSLVIAGAGSGKTRTLTYRVAYLIKKSIPPSKILLATFTNKAAKEMLERVKILVGDKAEKVWGGTFHHIAHLILRKHSNKVGISNNFLIIDRDDSISIIKQFLRRFKSKLKDANSAADFILRLYSLSVNSLKPVEFFLRGRNINPQLEDITEEVLREYEEMKRKSNFLDFDDLLKYLRFILKDNDEIKEEYSRRFSHILVDEYQDTNKIQAEIVDLLASSHRNVMVVGDDSQSIYSFRGANPENIFSFTKKYPDAKIYKLEYNYRSSPPILNLANNILKFSKRKHNKILRPTSNGGMLPVLVEVYDEFKQAEYVAKKISSLISDGYSAGEIAVLYRSHYQSMEMEMVLARKNFAFEVRSGLRFFERAHIKDIVSFLRVIVNPEDEISWKRLFKLFSGIRETTSNKLWEIISKHSAPLNYFIEEENIIKEIRSGRKSVLKIKSLFKDIIPLIKEGKPGSALQLILDQFYSTFLKEHFLNYEERIEDIQHLISYAEQFDDISFLISELSLYSTSESNNLDRVSSDRVVLSTIHQAKGLEWDVVFIIGLTEGRFPSAKALEEDPECEEERRLFYVATTRARKKLYLLYPRTGFFKKRDKRYPLNPSRFIREIPHNLVEFDETVEYKYNNNLEREDLEWFQRID